MQSLSVKTKYEKRIIAVLEGIRSLLSEAGYMVDSVEETSDDEYKWSFTVHLDRDLKAFGKKDIGIDFIIVESFVHEGTNAGINFELKIQGYGGRVLGSMAPFNFTPDVWVKKGSAVEERFKMFEELDRSEILETVEKHT
jgi:hypothetical protein